MRNDFTPDNVELWISNWKRKDVINIFAEEWLKSFDFERVNIITNHSSVTIEDFHENIRPKIKIWNNVMRHDDAIGPMVENYNQAYVHTFLSGKKYCICAHDNMYINSGWVDIIKNTDYDLYMAPQGDQVHLITHEGLKYFGWWDERYATNGNHELDYITRAVRKEILNKSNRASIVDYHKWDIPQETNFESKGVPFDTPLKNFGIPCTSNHPEFGNGFPYLRWNDVGLDKVWIRANKHVIPQCGVKTQKFQKLTWNDKKWRNESPNSYTNLVLGPTEEEIDWYPWLDIHSLDIDKCGIK
jgi:hypothetical protein